MIKNQESRRCKEYYCNSNRQGSGSIHVLPWYEKVKSPVLKSLFFELAVDEKKHREFLQRMLHKDASKMKFAPSHDYKVADTLELPALTATMKPLEGLVVAIRKELESMQMYTQLANLAKDTDTQLLFTQLVYMERDHKARLEDIYTNMAFPKNVWV